ncbi:MAG: hypothetical protein IJU84_08220 [Clostridia bacterium]|nr:hypothetical protein [Clostridia bacterium]
MTLRYKGFLSGNALKIIAAVCMVCDHIGFVFNPLMKDADIVFALRAIGRIAMPIFAFMIAEGFRYTKDRKKYFLTIFLLGLVCDAVYYIAMQMIYICILTTFSFSIAILFSYDGAINAIKEKNGNFFFYLVCFAAAVSAAVFTDVYIVGKGGVFDYGWIGALLPLFAYIVKKNFFKVLPFAAAVVGTTIYYLLTKHNSVYWFTLLSIVFLLAYNGERGKYKMKYFFYIFYPAHLLVLEGIFMLVAMLFYN